MSYPGLPGDRYHNLAKKYCPKGAGAVFTFGLKGGYDAGVKLVSNVKLFSHLANIGDTRSLIIHPASTTHRQLTDAQKVAAGAGPDVVRLSIGIEDKDDIIADLEQALARSYAQRGLSASGVEISTLGTAATAERSLRIRHDAARLRSTASTTLPLQRCRMHGRRGQHQHRHRLMQQRERERH